MTCAATLFGQREAGQGADTVDTVDTVDGLNTDLWGAQHLKGREGV